MSDRSEADCASNDLVERLADAMSYATTFMAGIVAGVLLMEFAR